jgi:hypothetical protein
MSASNARDELIGRLRQDAAQPSYTAYREDYVVSANFRQQVEDYVISLSPKLMGIQSRGIADKICANVERMITEIETDMLT